MSKLDASSSFMLFTRGGTPKPTIDLVARHLKKIIASPELLSKLISKLNAIGFDPTPLDADEAAKLVVEVAASWEKTIKGLDLLAKK